MARSSFGKRQREQAKRDKAAAKRDRKQQPAAPDVTDETDAGGPDAGALSTDELLDMIAQVHAQYEADAISYEEFEAARTDLLSRLVVD